MHEVLEERIRLWLEDEESSVEYAEEVGSDLITAGSVQHSRLDRWMVGSVSGELVRNGRRSVLVVPPPRRVG